jgi:hypothetical protein
MLRYNVTHHFKGQEFPRMPPSKVIRIDEEVWGELQRRARPLEDTPNSVLRRVFNLPDEAPNETETDHRIGRLLELLEERVGKRLRLSPARKGSALLSANDEPVAFIRSQRDRLRVTASKQLAQDAKLSDWHRERADTEFSGGSVSWYAPDADEPAFQELVKVLANLWKRSALRG